jgi:type VI secretion system protein ImpE
MTPQEYYEQGKLREAVAAATEEVRQHPGDGARRRFLVEMLLLSGEWERADRQLDALAHQDPQGGVIPALLRQLIRAETARGQLFTDGRLPEFLDQPADWLRQHLEATICLREGKPAEAARLLAAAEAARPRLAGACDGRRFDDFRDTDELIAGFFEVLTSNGKYYWVPADRVESVEFRAAERPRDLLWRRARMIVRNGPDGEVYLPALYVGTAAEADDSLRLGHRTEWRGGADAPVRGIGQRVFQAGTEDLAILDMQNLTFDAPAAPTP